MGVYLLKGQYITNILEYKPAPGQFTNTSYASPEGAESIVGNIQGAVSLGAFGGYIVFKFENPVQNDPNNPFGVDFTIFGNPIKDPVTQEVTWSEHGIVSVMKDENGNGLPDDTWYELAGSEYFFSSTIHDYAVTYTNPQQETASNVPWSDNQGESGFILINEYHDQPYYPTSELFPDINPNEYTLTGTRMPDEVDKSDPSSIKFYAKAFGYADNKPRNPSFTTHTIPDNPYTSERENSGGDAFDINWAVDNNGNYVDLDEIHFVKVHTGVLANAGWLGEVSTEIAGAVDVSPNGSINGVTEILILKNLPDTISGENYPIEIFAFQNGRYQAERAINWNLSFEDANIDEQNVLSCSSSGKIVITASLADNPSITATDSTYWHASGTYISESHPLENLTLYPNPSSEYFVIKGVDKANITIYDITGKQVLQEQTYQAKDKVLVNKLEKGVYIVNVSSKTTNKSLRFVKF